MKKFFENVLRTVVCVIGIFLYASICQAEETAPDIHYTLSDDGTLTISGIGALTDQKEIEKYSDSMKRLIIKEGITDLQGLHFWKCENLETVKLSASVKVLPDEVFAACKALKEVDMPGVTYIGVRAFRQCEYLEKVTNAKAVEEIEREAFMECDMLKWPSFGNRLKRMGNAAFYSCKSIKNVVIPDSVTEIGRLAFCYCENLEKLVIPASLKIWKKSITRHCPLLKTIVNHSRLSCQIYDFGGYKRWKADGKRVKNVPARKTAVAEGKKMKIGYKLNGGRKMGKLPEYYEFGTILRLPLNLKRKGYVMIGWDCWDDENEDTDGNYDIADPRLYIGPVERKPVMKAKWLEYSAKNTRKGTVVLKVCDPENIYDRDTAYFKYLVLCSNNKSMKNAKRKYITGYPAKAVFQNLKKGKTYYFQVGPIIDVEDDKPDFWLKKHKIKITK